MKIRLLLFLLAGLVAKADVMDRLVVKTNSTFRGSITYDLSDESALSFGNDYGAALDVGLTTTSVRARLRTVSTIADLVAADPTTSDLFSYVKVLGDTSAGDGGGGDFQRVLYSSVSSTAGEGGIWFQSSSNPIYAWVRTGAGDINVRWFGAKGDGVTDDSAAINAAITAAFRGGTNTSDFFGKVFVPAGVYSIGSTITVLPRVTLYGPETATFAEAGSISTNSALFKIGGSAIISAANSLNAPMIIISTNGASYLRQTTVLYDGTTNAQFYVNSGVKNLALLGRASAQTYNSSHGIEAANAWNFEITGVTIFGTRGNSMWIRNCNAFRVAGCNIVQETTGQGVFWDDNADYLLLNNFFFGANGPLVWVGGPGGWKGQIVGNLIGNSYAETKVATTLSTSVLTTTNHGYETGQMVFLNSTGTLPSPIITNQACFAIKLTANTFSIHTNRATAMTGSALTLTPGTGDLYVYRGKPVGLFMSHGANRVGVTANRFDQNYGAGISLQGTTLSSFTGNEVAENGTYGSPSVNTNYVAAFELTDGATLNTFTGNFGQYNDYAASFSDDSTGNTWTANIFDSTVADFDGTDAALSSNLIETRAAGDLGRKFMGGVGGVPVLVLERPQASQKIGLKVSTGAFQVSNEELQTFMLSLSDDATKATAQIGGTTGRDGYLAFPSTNGTDAAASSGYIVGPRGTGTNYTSGNLFIQLAGTNSSGTTIHPVSTKFSLFREGQIGFSEMASAPSSVTAANGQLWYGINGGVTNFFTGRHSEWSQIVTQPATTPALTWSGTNIAVTSTAVLSLATVTLTNSPLITITAIDGQSGGITFKPDSSVSYTVYLDSAIKLLGGGSSFVVTNSASETVNLEWKKTSRGGSSVILATKAVYP